MPLRKFASHHDQMNDLASAILRMAGGDSPEALAALQAKRIELSRLISNHCSAEIAHLNRQDVGHDDPKKAALVRKYHGDLLAWRGSLMECNANWPTRRIRDDPASFREVFGKLTDQLITRIHWEEREFYPAIFAEQASR